MPKYITKVCPVCNKTVKIDSRDRCCSRDCANAFRTFPIRPPTLLVDRIQIHLNTDAVAFVDFADADFAKMNWTTGFIRRPYARRLIKVNGKKRAISLHRMIMERILDRPLKSGEHVDHINGNSLDNRRANLRLATPAQNAANSKVPRTSKSGAKGVRLHKNGRRWEAHIKVNQKWLYLGMHDSLEAASGAYMTAARAYFGEFASDGKHRVDQDDREVKE